MDVTTMLAVVCTAYIAAYIRVIERHSILSLVERTGAEVPNRVPRWLSQTAFVIGLFIMGAAAGVVLSVVLDWYWSIW